VFQAGIGFGNVVNRGTPVAIGGRTVFATRMIDEAFVQGEGRGDGIRWRHFAQNIIY
jgi:hypothetical protein